MKHVLLLAFASSILYLTACKKAEDKAVEKDKVCSLQSVVRSHDSFWDSTVATLNGGVPGYLQFQKGINNGVVYVSLIVRKEFHVVGNTIYIVDLQGGSGGDTLIVDQSMRILERRSRSYYENCGVMDTIFKTEKYQTDNSGRLSRVDNSTYNTGQYSSSKWYLLFTFENGDLTTLSQQNAADFKYTYYPDLLQPASLPPFANLFNNHPLLTSGAFEYQNTHLVKSFTQFTSYRVDYSYVFDKVDGKILKVISTINNNGTVSTETDSYNYTCK
jgi:hypothetical protein